MSSAPVHAGYGALLTTLKAEVRTAQLRARRVVNTELLTLYWTIGDAIVVQQASEGWGTGVINRLADDLRAEFPDMRGFGRRNIHYMRAMASAWTRAEVVQQAVGQLPWGHVTVLLDKLDDQTERNWYAAAAVEHGWSRNVLLNHIVNRLHTRTGTGVRRTRTWWLKRACSRFLDLEVNRHGFPAASFRVRKDGVMPKKIDPAVKARAVRRVLEHRGEYPTLTAAAAAVARREGLGKETVRRWVLQAEVDTGTRPGTTSAENAEVKKLKAENARLLEDVAILKAAATSSLQCQADAARRGSLVSLLLRLRLVAFPAMCGPVGRALSSDVGCDRPISRITR